MNKFHGRGDFGILHQTLLEPVFDGFDVVIGAAFNNLDCFRISFGEIRYQIVELRDENTGTSLMADSRLNALNHSISICTR